MIESLLEEKIGLSVDAVGSETISTAVSKRMESVGMADIQTYLLHLEKSKIEWEKLVETVIVPETWFFRNRESFAFLGNYIKFDWMARNPGRRLRVLSFPCSTGEEPYSIAMTLMAKGIESDRFHIDAVDISSEVLRKAMAGIYGRNSFRGKDLSYRERFFDSVSDSTGAVNGFRMHAPVKHAIRFIRGNLMDDHVLAGEAPYDIIFFRNLLIYLNPSAKKRSIELMGRLLAKNGLLFVGHVERPIMNTPEFSWLNEPGVFACRKTSEMQSGEARKPGNVALKIRNSVARPHIPVDKVMSDIVQKGILETAKPSSPDPDLEPMLERAKKLADRGALHEAFELCEKCLDEGNPFDPQIHFLMGLICEGLGYGDLARDYYNKTLYLDPNHYEALGHMAFIEERNGDRQKAEQLRRRIRRIRGEQV